EIRARHEAVRVLVVLVRAHAVEAALRGVRELVERPVVVLAHAARVGQLPPGRRHPDGLVALLEVGGQLAIRHQMEGADLHRPLTVPGSAAGARSRRARVRPATRTGRRAARDRSLARRSRSAPDCGARSAGGEDRGARRRTRAARGAPRACRWRSRSYRCGHSCHTPHPEVSADITAPTGQGQGLLPPRACFAALSSGVVRARSAGRGARSRGRTMPIRRWSAGRSGIRLSAPARTSAFTAISETIESPRPAPTSFLVASALPSSIATRG